MFSWIKQKFHTGKQAISWAMHGAFGITKKILYLPIRLTELAINFVNDLATLPVYALCVLLRPLIGKHKAYFLGQFLLVLANVIPFSFAELLCGTFFINNILPAALGLAANLFGPAVGVALVLNIYPIVAIGLYFGSICCLVGMKIYNERILSELLDLDYLSHPRNDLRTLHYLKSHVFANGLNFVASISNQMFDQCGVLVKGIAHVIKRTISKCTSKIYRMTPWGRREEIAMAALREQKMQAVRSILIEKRETERFANALFELDITIADWKDWLLGRQNHKSNQISNRRFDQQIETAISALVPANRVFSNEDFTANITMESDFNERVVTPALNSFADIIEQSIEQSRDTNDFGMRLRTLIAPRDFYSFEYAWLFLQLPLQKKSNRYAANIFWQGIPADALNKAESEHGSLLCRNMLSLMTIPVYLPRYNAAGEEIEQRYYMDLFAALEQIKINKNDPELRTPIVIEDLKFDAAKFAEIQALKDQLRRQAAAVAASSAPSSSNPSITPMDDAPDAENNFPSLQELCLDVQKIQDHLENVDVSGDSRTLREAMVALTKLPSAQLEMLNDTNQFVPKNYWQQFDAETIDKIRQGDRRNLTTAKQMLMCFPMYRDTEHGPKEYFDLFEVIDMIRNAPNNAHGVKTLCVDDFIYDHALHNDIKDIKNYMQTLNQGTTEHVSINVNTQQGAIGAALNEEVDEPAKPLDRMERANMFAKMYEAKMAATANQPKADLENMQPQSPRIRSLSLGSDA